MDDATQPNTTRFLRTESPKWRANYRTPGVAAHIEIYDVPDDCWYPTGWSSVDALAAVYGPLAEVAPNHLKSPVGPKR